MSTEEPEQEQDQAWRPDRQSYTLAAITLSLAVLSVWYRVLQRGGLEQSAAMFIGLPTLLALLLIFTAPAKTGPGIAVKVTALFLALSALILQEGAICILIASPIFFGVAALCGSLAKSRGEGRMRRSVVLLPFVLMSLEGVHSAFEFERAEDVTVVQESTLSCREFLDRLAQPFDVEAELPPFLKLGFPAPQTCEGSGLRLGDQRRIHFAGGEGKPGDLVLEVVDSTPDSVIFRCLEDKSHIAHWLDWKEVRFSWTEGLVTAELSYDRLLDPAWYFRPIERYGVRCAGEHLLATFLNP